MRGVVEGLIGDEETESESDTSVEGSGEKRRVVYTIRDGNLTVLEHGVSEFESLMEEGIHKLFEE